VTELGARPFTPETLAERWDTTARNVRKLIHEGKLKHFVLGEKLMRIPVKEVERYECQTIAWEGSMESSSSSGMKADDAKGGDLARIMRLKRGLR
jgi:excisionase family DNA binding protein